MPDKIDILRALTVYDGSATVPAPPLSQPVIDKLVTQLVNYNNPIRVNFPRKKGTGYAYHLNRRTPVGRAGEAGGGLGNTHYVFISDTDTLTESTGTYAQLDFIYRTIGSQGKITRKAQAVGQSYANILADELEAKSMEFRDKEDWAIMWAYGTGSTDIGYDSISGTDAWDGLYHLCDHNNRFTGVGASAAAATMTLDILDSCIDAIRGDCNMMVTSKRGRRKINALLQAQQRFNDKIEVKGGFKVLSYNDIPIFTTSNCSDTAKMAPAYYDTKPGLTSLSSGDFSTVFFLDTSKLFMGVLTEITVQPLAKTTSQYDEFDMYCDEVVVCRDPKAMSVLHFNI